LRLQKPEKFCLLINTAVIKNCTNQKAESEDKKKSEFLREDSLRKLKKCSAKIELKRNPERLKGVEGLMKQRNINFRQSHSERAGESSYKNFHRAIVRKFKNNFVATLGKFKKYGTR